MVDDLLAICKAHELCNRFTLDTISMGVVLAWAMECYDKGILTKEQLNGIDLKWGNKDGMLKLIEDIARRKGIGDLLAEGVARASKKTGKGSEKFAMHVKGLEVAMHEPRGKKGFGVSMAVSNRGGCHVTMIDHDDFLTLDSNLVPELGFTHTIGLLDTSPEKTKLVKFAEDFKALYDSMDICMLMVYPWGPQIQVLPELVRSITGWDISLQELQRVGERAFDMTRAFNVREGINRKDDTLPPRFMEPLPDGVYKGQYLSQSELDSMLDSYYTHRGWTRDGIPTREKLRELEIEYIADKLSLPK
jgi:aldehyde:ferredoxin oxidoreductase